MKLSLTKRSLEQTLNHEKFNHISWQDKLLLSKFMTGAKETIQQKHANHIIKKKQTRKEIEEGKKRISSVKKVDAEFEKQYADHRYQVKQSHGWIGLNLLLQLKNFIYPGSLDDVRKSLGGEQTFLEFDEEYDRVRCGGMKEREKWKKLYLKELDAWYNKYYVNKRD